jgi:sigma-B regulation protein RsbU (phosphoserine phosphatase)
MNSISRVQDYTTFGFGKKPGRNLEIAAFMYSALNLSGDFIDYRYDSRQEILGIVIGDIQGHGQMAFEQAEMIRKKLEEMNWEEIFKNPAMAFLLIRYTLLKREMQDTLVTAASIVIDSKNGHLHYSTAGHPPLVLLSAGDTCRYLNRSGGPAMISGFSAPYGSASIDLQPGDTLLAYTDGFCEMEGPDGRMLGMNFDDIFLSWIRESMRGERTENQGMSLVESLREFRGTNTFDDDLSFILARYGK